MIGPETTLTLRERPFWECLDTGVLLLKTWLPSVLVFFGLPLVLTAVALTFLFSDFPAWVTMLVLWWLRPFWDRLILAWAGEMFFQPTLSWQRRWASLARLADPALAADLTWRRLSPFRTYLVPVSLFERGTMKDRSRRRRWLGKDMGGALSLLVLVFWLVEWIVFFLFWSALQGFFTDDASNLGWLGSAGVGGSVLYALVLLGVQPVRTLACFSLYLNTRTRKEGWDLSLVFRTMRQQAVKATGAVPVMLVLFGVASLTLPFRLQAFEPPRQPDPRPEAAVLWEEVLRDPAFGGTEPTRSLQFKNNPFSAAETPQQPDRPEGSLWGPEVLRTAAIAVGAAVLLALMVWGFWGRRSGVRPQRTILAPVAGPPSDWRTLALEAWQSGRAREALAVLYRQILAVAVRDYGLPIPTGATEGDCLRTLEKSRVNPEFSSAVQTLIRFWMNTTWGGQSLPEGQFQHLVDTVASAEGTRAL